MVNMTEISTTWAFLCNIGVEFRHCTFCNLGMIKRKIDVELKKLLSEYPVVTILGPRQAGKTTLAQTALEGFEYCNLESAENRDFALNDPKAFLSQFKGQVILDEVQRVPHLLSYIQTIVDVKKMNGQFVLTGSHQLALREDITQSLAGRTSILNLLPFSMAELTEAGITFPSFEDYAYHGFLPRIYDQKQRPTQAFSNYYQPYIERDVRQLINLKNAALFEKFMKLLAGRVGQIMDHTSLGNDVGVDAKTIKTWLSILEASFIIYKLNPYFENFGKRVIKLPKYYFIDTGLLTFLLGIERPDQLVRDPLVGNIFENMVVMECLKSRYNQGKLSNLYFFRDGHGNEVDVIYQDGRNLIAMEIKSSSTFNPALFKSLDKMKNLTDKISKYYLLYQGEEKILSGDKFALRFDKTESIFT
jgi:predicted AAA+ superfamily ATPase